MRKYKYNINNLDCANCAIEVEKELEMTNKTIEFLNSLNINLNNKKEKVHIIIGIIENLCHSIIYHDDDCFNYDEMKKEVILIIKYIINS